MEKRSKTNAQLSIAALFKASFLVLVVLLLPFPFFSCSEVPIPPGQTTPEGSRAARAVPVYTYRVVNAYPHDKTAFTQGLVYDGGALYEGTGLYRRSTLRKVERP